MASSSRAWSGISESPKVWYHWNQGRKLKFSLDIAEIRKLQPGEKNAIFCIYNFANHLQERVHSIFSPDTPRTGKQRFMLSINELRQFCTSLFLSASSEYGEHVRCSMQERVKKSLFHDFHNLKKKLFWLRTKFYQGMGRKLYKTASYWLSMLDR